MRTNRLDFASTLYAEALAGRFHFLCISCGKSQFSAEGLVQEGLFQRRECRQLLLVDPRQPLGFGGQGVELAFKEGSGILEGVGLGGGQTPQTPFPWRRYRARGYEPL